MMGIRGRIAIAISFVTALAVVVLGVAVHHISGLERDRQARANQDGLLSSALQVYQRDGTLALGAQLDDAALPFPLSQAVAKGQSGTYLSGGDDPRVWAATPVGDDKVLSISASFPAADPLQTALDRALVVARRRDGRVDGGGGVVRGAEPVAPAAAECGGGAADRGG
ncbi:hypothetical protein GCM10020000_50870 [Streptomyces olivoverticillatus]